MNIRYNKIQEIHQNISKSIYNKDKRGVDQNAEISLEPIIMNFNDVYTKQCFYQNTEYQWIDCTKIQGTNCYCDDTGKEQIRSCIQQYPLNGIHYIDSGNYHYISEIWLEKAKEPFVLVVFDHHTDMQPSLFESLLSCGCWVKAVLDTNPFLQKVFIIGAKEELIGQIPKEYQERVICYSEHSCCHETAWQVYLDKLKDVPFYISIDKDVLAPKEVMTNWDQGSMSLTQLESFLHHILENHRILGIDICGEYTENETVMMEQKANSINSEVNEELLEVICTTEML